MKTRVFRASAITRPFLLYIMIYSRRKVKNDGRRLSHCFTEALQVLEGKGQAASEQIPPGAWTGTCISGRKSGLETTQRGNFHETRPPFDRFHTVAGCGAGTDICLLPWQRGHGRELPAFRSVFEDRPGDLWTG